uniref:Uncharacterized protein n=1 Tax=Rhizophora mucronata TaxID=61149 RepID=A0A2P2MXL2_RHIMU
MAVYQCLLTAPFLWCIIIILCPSQSCICLGFIALFRKTIC